MFIYTLCKNPTKNTFLLLWYHNGLNAVIKLHGELFAILITQIVFLFFLMNNQKDWKVLLILWLSVQLRGPPIEKPPWTRWYQCSRPCWSLCTWPDRQWRRRWSLSGCVNTGASRSVWTPPKRWNLNGNKEGDVSDLWSTSHDIRIIIIIIIIIVVMGV